MNLMRKIPSKWLVVIAVLLGTFTVILNNSMLNPTLPNFMRLFDADAVTVSWLLTIYMVATGMTMPLTGYLGDRFGKKRIYLLGLAVFMLGSVGGALAPTLEVIIFFRAVQGMAGGLMMPIAMALIFQAFPKNERGLAVGIYGVAVMIAPAIGPTVGGIVIEFFHWPFLFIFNIPFALLGFLFSYKFLQSTEQDRTLKFDYVGFILITIGIGAVLYALGQASTLALLVSTKSIVLIVVGALFIATFIWYELKQEQPLLDLRIFKIPTYVVSIAITSATSIALFSGIFLIPLLLQHVYHLGEIETGLLFLPAALVSGLFMSLGGRLLDKKGPRAVIPLGLLILATFTLMLGFNTMSTSFFTILLLNSLRSAGLGMSNMPATTAGMNSIPDDRVAQGSAMNNIIRQMAASFSIVLFSIYYEVRKAHLFIGDVTVENAALQAINESFIIAGIVIFLVFPFSFILKK